MGDVDRRRLLNAARAELLEQPDADLPGIPGHVAASWRRSLARGVDPGVVANHFHPELDVESRLVRCARPVMEQLAEQVAGIPVCLALTDEQARLLVRLDATAAEARLADSTYFATGFGYAEGVVGTNGIGTVLEFGGPVYVVGAEHFVEQLQDYSCAGAPVRDPMTGRTEGVLDISCRVKHSSPLLLSMVTAAAQRIQTALLHDRNAEQRALFDLYDRVNARTRNAVLAVGQQTMMTNTRMQTLLDLRDLAALQDHARFLMGRGPGIDDRLDLPSGTEVRIRGTTLDVGRSFVGLVVVVTIVREADGAVSSFGRSGPSPGVPVRHTAWVAASSALRERSPLIVVGERGSGRRRLILDVHAAVHNAGHVVEINPTDELETIEERLDETPDAGPATLVLLRNLDSWTEPFAAAVATAIMAKNLPVAATGTGAASYPASLATLMASGRHSVMVLPLRHRSCELRRLVSDLLAELAPDRTTRVSAEALRILTRYSWPGNVAELREVLQEVLQRRAVEMIEAQDLPTSVHSAPRFRLRPVDQAERDTIVEALRESGGNRMAAAAALGLARSTLYRKIAQYGITG